MNRSRFPVLALAGVLLTAAGWPQHRGGPGHRGVAPGALPSPLRLLWTYRTDGPVRSTPVIAGGLVYVGSGDGRLHAIRAADGSRAWRHTATDAIEAPALVLGDAVLVGDAAGVLHALAAADGRERWTYRTGGKIVGAPNRLPAGTNGEELVVVGSYDNRLHAVRAEDGTPAWTYASENFINGSPSVDGGLVAFGGCDSRIHVLGPDGKARRTIDTNSYIAATMAVAGGLGYVGHYGNRFVCVDLETGTVRWTYRDRDFPYFSSAAVGETLVVVGSRDKRLHAIRRADGKPAWTFQARGSIDSSPVICGDAVVVGSDDGRLYVVSLADGTERWSYEIGTPLPGSPAVAGGLVVIGGEDGNVYAFGAAR